MARNGDDRGKEMMRMTRDNASARKIPTTNATQSSITKDKTLGVNDTTYGLGYELDGLGG